MPPGPILIFDKSFLQSLNVDEAAWLDNFFLSAITPLFFVETLADLEKEVHGGRTQEQVVGGLAQKTPGLQSHMATHHGTLLGGVDPNNRACEVTQDPNQGGRVSQHDSDLKQCNAVYRDQGESSETPREPWGISFWDFQMKLGLAHKPSGRIRLMGMLDEPMQLRTRCVLLQAVEWRPQEYDGARLARAHLR